MGRFSWIFTNFWHVDPTRLGLEHSWKPKQKLPKSETPRSIFKSRLDFITDKKIHQKSPKCSESQGTFGSTFCLKKKHPGTPLIVPSGKVRTCRHGTKLENLFRVSKSIQNDRLIFPASYVCLRPCEWNSGKDLIHLSSPMAKLCYHEPPAAALKAIRRKFQSYWLLQDAWPGRFGQSLSRQIAAENFGDSIGFHMLHTSYLFLPMKNRRNRFWKCPTYGEPLLSRKSPWTTTLWYEMIYFFWVQNHNQNYTPGKSPP